MVEEEEWLLSWTPRPGHDPWGSHGPSEREAAFQEQLLTLQLDQQKRILQEQKELDSRQQEIWKQQKDALDQKKKDVASNAKLAQQLAEAEAAQLKAKTAETKAAQEAAMEKAKMHEQEVKRLEKQ